MGSSPRDVINSFWDIESSGVPDAVGEMGLTTAEMQDINTFLQAGWDFLGESVNGSAETWTMAEGGGYPDLTLFADPGRLPVAAIACPMTLDVTDVLWESSSFFRAEWDTVSLARMSTNWARQPENSSLPSGPILTVSGRIHILDGNDIVALSSENSLVCRVLDDKGHDVPFGALPRSFSSSVECWRILPRRPLPFTLQIRLDDTLPLPERLSEVGFSATAFLGQPLVTVDIPFEPMTAPVELVPGFSVQIEAASSEDGKCEFTIKEYYADFNSTARGILNEDSSPCDDEIHYHHTDLAEIGLNYNATMIDATGNPTSKGGSTSSRGDGSMRTWEGSWTRCSGIEVVRYTIAVRPYKIVVPLTLTDVPLPRGRTQ